MVDTNPLTYDVVIATRNRPDALSLSIPRILSETRPPARLIVSDSSDDHDEICRAVEEASAGTGAEIEVIQSDPGLPLQRNVGLERVSAPVVMYPDDDSIWYPGVAEAVMRVYERDTQNTIAAVATAEAAAPPPGFLDSAQSSYQMQSSHKLKQRIAHTRAKIERRWFPDPFVLHGRAEWERFEQPGWFGEENTVPVEWMTGFRMSFRTKAIRDVGGFDQAFAGYALFEDVDASFAVAKHGLVVGARNAQVFHYRRPGGRGNRRRLGVTQLLNRAYVIAKHATPGSSACRKLAGYGRYKISQYALEGPGGKERIAGAMAAQKHVRRLLQAQPGELQDTYQQAIRECLSGHE